MEWCLSPCRRDALVFLAGAVAVEAVVIVGAWLAIRRRSVAGPAVIAALVVVALSALRGALTWPVAVDATWIAVALGVALKWFCARVEVRRE